MFCGRFERLTRHMLRDYPVVQSLET